jgi:hypothetical protein
LLNHSVIAKIPKKRELLGSSPDHQGASTYHIISFLLCGARPLTEFFIKIFLKNLRISTISKRGIFFVILIPQTYLINNPSNNPYYFGL